MCFKIISILNVFLEIKIRLILFSKDINIVIQLSIICIIPDEQLDYAGGGGLILNIMLILCEKEAKIFKLFKHVTSVLLHSNVQNRKLESWH